MPMQRIVSFAALSLRSQHMHCGTERRLCVHEEIGLHFFRGLERGDFAECRHHYTKGIQQTPYVKEHGLCRNVTDEELMTSACSGLPIEKGTPLRDGCQTYLATLGRPLGSEKKWKMTGVAVVKKLESLLATQAEAKPQIKNEKGNKSE